MGQSKKNELKNRRQKLPKMRQWRQLKTANAEDEIFVKIIEGTCGEEIKEIKKIKKKINKSGKIKDYVCIYA